MNIVTLHENTLKCQNSQNSKSLSRTRSQGINLERLVDIK